VDNDVESIPTDSGLASDQMLLSMGLLESKSGSKLDLLLVPPPPPPQEANRTVIRMELKYLSRMETSYILLLAYQ
jgi:hypothetical protein